MCRSCCKCIRFAHTEGNCVKYCDKYISQTVAVVRLKIQKNQLPYFLKHPLVYKIDRIPSYHIKRTERTYINNISLSDIKYNSDFLTEKSSSIYTTPPKHFTEDSLLSAMERAGNEDMSDDVERKGLGTPATRADIIEKLVKDGFVKREKKQMLPTEDGMKLITVLPDVVKSSKLTADWENALTLVAKGEMEREDFMAGLCNKAAAKSAFIL